MAQAGVVRDALATGARAALERGARDIRSRADARGPRDRDGALAELGAVVLELIRAGEIDLEELPEVQDIVDELDLIDRDRDDGRPRRGRVRRRDDGELDRFAKFDHDDRGDDDDTARPWSRDRFDDRDRPRRDSDGTVSAASGPIPAPRRVSTQTQVWRPAAQAAATAPSSPSSPGSSPASPHVNEPRSRSSSAGGIAFDDDDLDEYMHPDDVPAKAKASDDPPSDS